MARTVLAASDGAGHTASVEAMFPPDVAEVALEDAGPVDQDEAERAARAAADR